MNRSFVLALSLLAAIAIAAPASAQVAQSSGPQSQTQVAPEKPYDYTVVHHAEKSKATKAFKALFDEKAGKLTVTAFYKAVTVRVYTWKKSASVMDDLDDESGTPPEHRGFVRSYVSSDTLRPGLAATATYSVGDDEGIEVTFTNPLTGEKETITLRKATDPD